MNVIKFKAINCSKIDLDIIFTETTSLNKFRFRLQIIKGRYRFKFHYFLRKERGVLKLASLTLPRC